VIQGMTMTTEAPQHFKSAVHAMSEAAAEAELTHAPIRLAYWRMAALDAILARLEELRLANERELPDDILELVVGYADRNDRDLAERLHRIDSGVPVELNAIHDALFEAQGRVMLRLAELRQVPNWQDLDLTLEPGDDEAA
jgi:hypothetical protein